MENAHGLQMSHYGYGDDDDDESDDEFNVPIDYSTIDIEVKPEQPTSCCGTLKAQVVQFLNTILCPKYFLLFNLICITQTVRRFEV